MKIKSKRHHDNQPRMVKVIVKPGERRLTCDFTHEIVMDEIQVSPGLVDMFAQQIEQEIAELADDADIFSWMVGKTGKTQEKMFEMGLSVKRWSALHNWPDADTRLDAELDLFNKLLRM